MNNAFETGKHTLSSFRWPFVDRVVLVVEGLRAPDARVLS